MSRKRRRFESFLLYLPGVTGLLAAVVVLSLALVSSPSSCSCGASVSCNCYPSEEYGRLIVGFWLLLGSGVYSLAAFVGSVLWQGSADPGIRALRRI